MKGKKIFSSNGKVQEGEFQDGMLYNGTEYYADGSVDWKVINGKWKMP